jgi:RNA polymerase sigma-70 factor (ECF subfamily)
MGAAAIAFNCGMAMVDEDLVLIDRYLAGDQTAFEKLYQAYYERVFAIAHGILGEIDEAKDAVQEVFALVVRHLEGFDRRSKFSTWIFRIAVNRSIQQARKNKHIKRQLPLEDSLHIASNESPKIEDDYSKIHQALQQLQPSDRAALVLFYWDELSVLEIADTLGCTVNAAKTRLYRARERFKAVYESEDEN